MGGKGSGPYGNGGKTAKTTVEGSLSLDVNDLKNDLYEGNAFVWSWSWTIGTSPLTRRERREVAIFVEKESIVLSYSTSNQKHADPVSVTWTKCNYEGQRPWFLCPGCSRKVAKLYLKNSYFRCRRCHDMTYLSCQISGNDLFMINHKMYTLAAKLQVKDFKVDEWDRVYIKPKGMHQKTFDKLRWEMENLGILRMKAWLELTNRTGF